jgi:hypothetical protein
MEFYIMLLEKWGNWPENMKIPCYAPCSQGIRGTGRVGKGGPKPPSLRRSVVSMRPVRVSHRARAATHRPPLTLLRPHTLYEVRYDTKGAIQVWRSISIAIAIAIALPVAGAFFMEQLDGTVIAAADGAAVQRRAGDFNVGISAYLFTPPCSFRRAAR